MAFHVKTRLSHSRRDEFPDVAADELGDPTASDAYDMMTVEEAHRREPLATTGCMDAADKAQLLKDLESTVDGRQAEHSAARPRPCVHLDSRVVATSKSSAAMATPFPASRGQKPK